MIWVDECTYKLVMLKTKTPEKTFLSNVDTLLVKISAIEGDLYRYDAELNGKVFTGDLQLKNKTITKLNTD